jgi:hypothetical protein
MARREQAGGSLRTRRDSANSDCAGVAGTQPKHLLAFTT